MDTAEEHLHQRRQPQKEWISVDTLKLTEKKWLYSPCMLADLVHLCKKVRKEVRSDKSSPFHKAVECRNDNVGGEREMEQTGRLFSRS